MAEPDRGLFRWLRGPCALFGLFAFLGMLVPQVGRAGDASIVWRSLRTDEVEVHFPRGYERLAQRVLAAAHDARRAVAVLAVRKPGKLHLTLDDYVDGANGFASPLPFDRVHLLAYPPEPTSDLGDHGDWLRALVFHETAHIVHMGEVSGIPHLANHLVGRRWLPNAMLPGYLLEGAATWAETHRTGGEVAVAGRGGRLQSASFLQYQRAAVLEGQLPGLDELTGRPLTWPRGNAWYVHGSWLVDHLVQRGGIEALRELFRLYGQRVVAYGLQGLAREVWGASLSRMWQDAGEALRQQVAREIRDSTGVDLPAQATRMQALEREGDGPRLTTDGEWRGRIRPWPDGRSVVVAHGPADRRSQIERIDLTTGAIQVVHVCELDCDEPLVTPDGRWLLWTESRRQRRLYLPREVMAAPLARDGTAGPALRLTHGLRGRAIALDPTGQVLLAVAVRRGATELRALRWQALLSQAQAGETSLDLGTVLVPPAPLGTTLDTPVVLGDRLYWTEGTGGRRVLMRAPMDLRRLALTGPGRRVPGAFVAGEDPLLRRNLALSDAEVDWVADLQAFQTADGPRLGALIGLQTFRDAAWLDPARPGQGWRLRTRTLTGLVSAAHLADGAATVRHHARGLDVHRAPDTRLPDGTVRQAPRVPPPLQAYQPPDPPPALATPYNPLRTVHPRAWSPILTLTGDSVNLLDGGLWLGASVHGEDALEQLMLDLTAQARSDGSEPVWQAVASWLRWEPRLDLSAAYQQGTAWFRRGFRWYPTATDRYGTRLGLGWVDPGLRTAWHLDAAVRLVHSSLRDSRFDRAVLHDPVGPVPLDPWTGLDALADVGAGWALAESYTNSIVTERLHRVAGRITVGDRWEGRRPRLFLQATTGHHWPLGKHRVLALDARLDLAPKPGEVGGQYSVRGVTPFEPTQVLGLGGGPGPIVRGLPADGTGLGGNGLLTGSLALHLPLRDVARGLETLPVWLGRLRLEVFADGAWAFWEDPSGLYLPGSVVALGAELSVDYELGYALGGLLRVGWARAFGPFGGMAGYVTVGR